MGPWDYLELFCQENIYSHLKVLINKCDGGIVLLKIYLYRKFNRFFTCHEEALRAPILAKFRSLLNRHSA